MKKVLFVATVVKKHIMVFHLPYLEWFKNQGYEVHVCAKNDYDKKEDCKIPFCDKYIDLPFERSPFHYRNLNVYKELKNVINNNQYEIIHCHTPMGGVLTRLAAKKARSKGTKVIYTAHGFHFFKGAPIQNWILYYPIERWLAKYTDVLITINKEDYLRSNNFSAKEKKLIPGVGIDSDRFIRSNNKDKRKEFGIPEDAIILLSVGEVNKNKNHQLVIKALSTISNTNVYYLICGQGDKEAYLTDLSKSIGSGNNIKLLGYRKDIKEIYNAADVFVFPSLREGLSVALMEAMASELPVVCTKIRGNRDLIDNGEGGYVVDSHNVTLFADAISKLIMDQNLRLDMGVYNRNKIEAYKLDHVIKLMAEIYVPSNED